MIHSASPQFQPSMIFAWFWSFGTDARSDGQTTCVKIVINFRTGLWSASWIKKRHFCFFFFFFIHTIFRAGQKFFAPLTIIIVHLKSFFLLGWKMEKSQSHCTDGRKKNIGKKGVKLTLLPLDSLALVYWPTRPWPNRWSLFLHMVSVRPSVRHKSKNKSRPGKQNKRTPCVKIMTIYWLGPGGSLWSLPTCLR